MNIITLTYDFLSTKGSYHKTNEDSYTIIETSDYYLLCVADGIGGLPDGAQASQIVIHTIQTQFQTNPNLSSLIQQANQTLLQENSNKQKIMGSTLTMALVNKKTAAITIATSGDSRAYLKQKTLWKTKDHTLVQNLVDLDIITETQAYHHPMKHRLYTALGIHTNPTYDIYEKQPPYEYLLLCTDGLHDYIQDTELHTIISSYQLKDVCTILEDTARSRGSTDDITILITTFKET